MKDIVIAGILNFSLILAVIILIMLVGYNVKQSSIKKSCKNLNSFYIGETIYDCKERK